MHGSNDKLMEAEIFMDFSNGKRGKPRMIREMRQPTMKNHLLYVLIGAIALILIPYATASQPRVPKSDSSAAIVATSSPVQTDSEREEEAMEQYLSQLTWIYECTGQCAVAFRNDRPYKRLDSNNKYSYGCLQFQEATWLAMSKIHNVDPWSEGGIYSCEKQWELAKKMFREDKVAAAQHWYTSVYVRGLGLPNIK